MRHIVSYSGGVCSALAAVRVAEKHGTANMVLLFADTLIEDEDLYRFNDDFSQFLGVPITRIADGRDPWQVFRSERIIGNSRSDPCSKILKRQLLWKWIKANCDKGQSVIYLGIDWLESNRLERTRKVNKGWNIQAPMTEAPYLSKQEMIKEVEGLGIKPPRLYLMGFQHNNCGGFCIKSGQAQFALLLKRFPERYRYHEEQEEALRVMLGDYSILRNRRKNNGKNGLALPMTLKEFRQRIDAKEPHDEFDWGGCGCGV